MMRSTDSARQRFRLSAHPMAVISLAALLATSLWFSANGAADGLADAWGAGPAEIGLLTAAVQSGFIAGTLMLAFSGIADRFAASRIFVCSAVLGAAFNAAFALLADGLAGAAVLRFLVGVCIAGIYPVGMKLAVRWSPDRTGLALALMVGMLVLGTALPHGLRWAGADFDWRMVILASSGLALVAAAMIGRLGDPPQAAASSAAPLQVAGVMQVFRLPRFRASALGYFGHMWELYAFWTLVPMLVVRSALGHGTDAGTVSALAFVIIGIGAIGCIWGGMLVRRIGSARIAAAFLATSGACCLVFGLAGDELSTPLAAAVLLIWGFTVGSDSPQFSALSAQNCPTHLVGSALSMQNGIGFAITLVSIALVTALIESWGAAVALLLLPGPVLGLIGSYRLWRDPPDA